MRRVEKIPAPNIPAIGEEAEVVLLTLDTPPVVGMVADGDAVGAAIGDVVASD